MLCNIKLPQWLDELIFNQKGASYCPSKADMTVIDWDRSDILNYLGTYFPRSYAEAYCLFSDYFQRNGERYADKTMLDVLDFGCGTGGQSIGLLAAVSQCLPQIESVSITAFDGNRHAINLFEDVAETFNQHMKPLCGIKPICVQIDDFYDLSVLSSIMSSSFDIIMTFKAICEFVTKDVFERQNAYAHFVKTFLPKMRGDGMMLIADITTYSNVTQQWLPKMMDAGLAQANCQASYANDGFNQAFTVSHSRRTNDISKIAWKIITH